MAVLITAFLLVVMPVTLSKANKSTNFLKSQNFIFEAGKITTAFLRNCLRQEDTVKVPCGQNCGQSLLNCLYGKGFALLDRLLEKDEVELMDGLELVRYKSDNQSDQEWHSRSINKSHDQENVFTSGVQYEIYQRLDKLFSTHFLKIYKPKQLDFVEGEARHRRRHHMMPMMMVFGVLVLGMVIVPMGFQLLAILGGKALLLAKMALLLTAIQGLKKIATSPYNYGLYQAAPYPWYSDRKWLDDDTGINDNYQDSYPKTPGKSSGLFSFLS
ncbi:uncharacterized protein LOC108741928 [Agrilus planipennis]|uniref:Uncharacterized protein LOC108741928 n=1 Tax=Agrilus planipennis TaxID=224129 RepID=A0A1W4X8Q0_AGRPL|nr:uncharacterized protein LOC108741928 [Agrilus planipennis]